MIPILSRLSDTLGAIVMAGGLLIGGTSFAAPPDREDTRPPQTLPRGFESTDQLQQDVEKNERAPLYSAWLIESSRFVNVSFGSFMPDRDFVSPTTPNHDIQFIDFPVNLGVIKGPDGNITL